MAKKLENEKYFKKIEREANIIASETDMVGDTPTQRKVGYVNEKPTSSIFSKTCHDCGLEAIDNCETENVHIPFDESKFPCLVCQRNSKTKINFADFFSENWCLDENNDAIIEDPNKRDLKLLRLLRDIEILYPYPIEELKNRREVKT